MNGFDAQIALQTALMSALSAASFFTTNGVGIFDMVPKDTPVPFITIGDFMVVDNSTQGIFRQTLTLQIHSWTQNLSSLLLKQIMGELVAVLHDQTLTLSTGFKNSNTRFVSSQVMKDPDGLTLHGVSKFFFNVENS